MNKTSEFKLGMPHLTFNGLDSIWLMKTLGDVHWNFLSLLDQTNVDDQRLYASFFATDIDFGKGQQEFKENDALVVDSKIFKFNKKIYRSVHTATTETNRATIILDSIFVRKNTQGTLIKDDPIETSETIMDKIDSVFLGDHKHAKVKSNKAINQAELIRLPFSPEGYFNGVKILYFANYFNLVLLSHALTYKKILNPIKQVRMFFFKNISETDEVFGYTVRDGAEYETTLVVSGTPIAYCRITRDE